MSTMRLHRTQHFLLPSITFKNMRCPIGRGQNLTHLCLRSRLDCVEVEDHRIDDFIPALGAGFNNSSI
jgi:hypothetical protein